MAKNDLQEQERIFVADFTFWKWVCYKLLKKVV